MRRPAILHDFVSVRPRYEYQQSDSLEWFSKFYSEQKNEPDGPDNLRRMRVFFRRFGCGPDRIQTRSSDLADFQTDNFQDGELYTLPRKGPISALLRTTLYNRFANQHFKKMFADKVRARPPHHLMHVTCTGYISPSPAQILVDDMGWHGQTDVTHLYHMGCYGAMPAVRLAESLVQSNPDRRVDIAHTELCTLHMDVQEMSPEQAVIQSLFADGAIRYSVALDVTSGSVPGLALIDVQELIVPGTREHMTWKVGDSGLVMTLSRDVPTAVVSNLPRFLAPFLSHPDSASAIHRLSNPASHLESPEIPKLPKLDDRYKNYLFAIHPGGPRIIDTIQESLGLSADQVRHSIEVLRHYGNMSSATLPHVWQRIIQDPQVPDGQEIISLAFGPGLTIFGSLMRKVT